MPNGIKYLLILQVFDVRFLLKKYTFAETITTFISIFIREILDHHYICGYHNKDHIESANEAKS